MENSKPREKRPKPVFEAEPIFSAPKIVPLTYHVILKPKPPRKQIGVLFTSKRTQKAQQAVCTMGQIVAIGPLAWRSNTPDLDYSKDPIATALKVGDWVVYKQHGGQKQRYGAIKSDDDLEEYLLIVADSDVIGQVQPDDADKFYDWVG